MIAGLVIAIVKPWDPPRLAAPGATRAQRSLAAAAPPRSTAATTPTASATAAPTATAVPRPPDSTACYSDTLWRLVSVERSQRGEQRTWFAVEPILDATGPDDPRIPFRSIVSPNIVAVGFCAPLVDAAAGAGATPLRPRGAMLWDVTGGQPQPVNGAPLVEQPESFIAELYHRDRRGQNWPAARIVFAVPSGRGDSVAWFGLRIAVTRERR